MRADRLGDTVVVHNYGHGGCGVTLSWGTAQLAAIWSLETRSASPCSALARWGSRPRACCKSAARSSRLRARRAAEHDLRRGRRTLVSVRRVRQEGRDGGVPRRASNTARAAYRAFRALPAAEYGIYHCPTYCFQNTSIPPTSLLDFHSPVHDLLPGLRDLSDAEKPAAFPVVRTWKTMMIEPATYLPALVRAFGKAGGTIVTKDLDRAQVLALPEKTIVNCTGLGAGALFGDTELSIEGELTILPSQPEVDWVALPQSLYMFPRKDGIVLGGTFQHHIATMAPDLDAEQRILDGHAAFYAQLSGAAPSPR